MNLNESQVIATREFGPISRTDIVRYQGASGDFNPIHHDIEFAKSAGFEDVFVVGMLIAGYLATFASDLVGVEFITNFKIRFQAQTWPGDRIICSAKIISTQQQVNGNQTQVTLELIAKNQSGVLAATAQADAQISSNSPLLSAK
jgi:acyl dehydratase